MKRMTMILSILLVTTAMPVLAAAGPVPGPGTRPTEQYVDRVALADDHRDLKELERLVRRLDRAMMTHNASLVLSVDRGLSRYLAAEIAESRRELAAARAEVLRDRSGRVDDVRDLRREEAELNRKVALAGTLSRIQGRLDNGAMSLRRSILFELRGMARNEIQRSAMEFQEDRIHGSVSYPAPPPPR